MRDFLRLALMAWIIFSFVQGTLAIDRMLGSDKTTFGPDIDIEIREVVHTRPGMKNYEVRVFSPGADRCRLFANSKVIAGRDMVGVGFFEKPRHFAAICSRNDVSSSTWVSMPE